MIQSSISTHVKMDNLRFGRFALFLLSNDTAYYLTADSYVSVSWPTYYDTMVLVLIRGFNFLITAISQNHGLVYVTVIYPVKDMYT